MLHLVTSSEDIIMAASPEITFWDNGYPVLNGVAYALENVHLYENVQTDKEPMDVVDKLCYTKEKGFYENANYRAPGADIMSPAYKAGYDQAVLDMINDGIL